MFRRDGDNVAVDLNIDHRISHSHSCARYPLKREPSSLFIPRPDAIARLDVFDWNFSVLRLNQSASCKTGGGSSASQFSEIQQYRLPYSVRGPAADEIL